jgi:hypothetical protein
MAQEENKSMEEQEKFEMFLDKIQHPTKEKYFHEFIKHLYS